MMSTLKILAYYCVNSEILETCRVIKKVYRQQVWLLHNSTHVLLK